jgi:hypothetical protein
LITASTGLTASGLQPRALLDTGRQGRLSLGERPSAREFFGGRRERVGIGSNLWGMTAEERRDYHLAEFKKACEELDPMIGHWSRFYDDQDDGRMSLHAFRVTGRYEGDGIYESGKPNLFGKRGTWSVALRPDTIDGYRCFEVKCPGERVVLTEPALQTFIGRKPGVLIA